jgi:DNA polymerase-3 subunit gamma/tau
VISAVPDAATSLLADLPADQIERMRGQAGRFGPAELSRSADIINAGLVDMKGTTSPRLQLELMCARVLLPAAADDERSLQGAWNGSSAASPGAAPCRRPRGADCHRAGAPCARCADG